jgi:tetratricopeptide (TPR) repeat protein
MAEIPVSALDARAQKMIENARVALQRGNFDYAVEVTGQVLKQTPGCLAVRKLQRSAQLKAAEGKNKLFTKAFGSVTQAGFLLRRKDPAKQMENAERMIAADPHNPAGLKMLAAAAVALELPETVAFAWECLRELQPQNCDTLLGLGEAYIASGRAQEALAVADGVLKMKPQDGDALALMRKASVAQTMDKGKWEDKGSFRDKLSDEKGAVSLERASKVVTSADMTRRLLEEALTRHWAEPENLDHLCLIVDAQRKLGDLAAAGEWVQKARQIPSGAADTTLERLESDLRVAVLEKDFAILQGQLDAKPEDVGAAVALAKAQGELIEFRLGQARSYVARYPNDYGARFTLANLFFEKGDYQNAIANYQQAQKNPKVRIAALAGMGKSLKARRMFDLAVAQFQSAKAELPVMDDLKKEIIYELADCFEMMGKAKEAINEYKTIYSDDIGFRDVANKINAFYASS